MINNNPKEFNQLLDEAYKCSKQDLNKLLNRIEVELKRFDPAPKALLNAKLVVTTRLISRKPS